MLDRSAVRAAARIPWIRRNIRGFRFLWSTFRLLLALHRNRRYRDFCWVLGTFLEMAHSFAQYGRCEAKDTMDRLLEIPWFAERHREVLRLVSAYNHLVAALGLRGPSRSSFGSTLHREKRAVDEFVQSVKTVLGFDPRDEEQVRALQANARALEQALEAFTSAAR